MHHLTSSKTTYFDNLFTTLNSNFNALQNYINNKYNEIQTSFDNFQNEVNTEVSALKSYVDISIEENNEQLLNDLSKQFKNLKVAGSNKYAGSAQQGRG